MSGHVHVLTVRQPWASLIVAGLKDIENRTWPTSFRGRLYIHSAKSIDREAWTTWGDLVYGCPTGAIIGSVDVVDVVKDHSSLWAREGHWNWVLGEAEMFDDEIPVMGRLGIWRCDIGEQAIACR